jgi:hypothetical protein
MTLYVFACHGRAKVQYRRSTAVGYLASFDRFWPLAAVAAAAAQRLSRSEFKSLVRMPTGGEAASMSNLCAFIFFEREGSNFYTGVAHLQRN